MFCFPLLYYAILITYIDNKIDDKIPQPILHTYIRYFKTKFKKDLTEKDYDRLIYKQKYYNELEIATTEDYNKYQQYFTDL